MKRTLSSGSRVPPAVTRTRRPSSDPAPRALEELLAAVEDLFRLRHPPRAGLALGQRTLRRSDDLDASGAKGLDVRLRGRVLPHAGVHGRRDENRTGVRERRLGEHVVGQPVGELGQRVRSQRGDHQQIRLREVWVRVVVDRVVRQGGERLLGDEALGATRHQGKDLVPGQHETPCELARLVGGNPARHAEEDASHRAPAVTCTCT